LELYAEFGWLEVIHTHRTLIGMYKSKRRINMLAENQIPRFTSRQHMFAYQAFADGCQHFELLDIDFMKIKKLLVYVNGSIWKFRYKIKSGWFTNDYYEFEWDEDWEKKIKEQEKLEKEEESRRKRMRRRR